MALDACLATSALFENGSWDATLSFPIVKSCILIKSSSHGAFPLTLSNPSVPSHRISFPVPVSVGNSQTLTRSEPCTFSSVRTSSVRTSSVTRANPCLLGCSRPSLGFSLLNNRRWPIALIPLKAATNEEAETRGDDEDPYSVARKTVWSAYGAYIVWLFLLPYAPGDPVWDIKWETIQLLLDLSQNFFFILPGLNALGIHFMEAPILHPTSECLFNFVNAWGLLFGPLLASDKRQKNFGGSIGLIWTSQMFLTNVFLIPYMALRLQPLKKKTEKFDENSTSFLTSLNNSFCRGLSNNSIKFGIIGITVGIISIFWAFFGRPENGFGDISDRWQFFLNYVSEDRAAYAFFIDLVFYSVFQAWIIGDNLKYKDTVEDSRKKFLETVRFVPFFGLALYLILSQKEEQKKMS